jgi:cell division septal protein FtsQ
MRRTLLPRKFFNNKGTILLILTFFILATSALFASDYFFNIVNIKIVTSGDRVQIRGIEQFKNKNLLFMSIAQTQRYLIENNPQIKSFNIEKKYPDTLEIKITHEEPNAQLKANEGYFILSDLGKIIRKSVKKKPRSAGH